MKQEKSLSQDEIFARMHRELRSWNREIPESPDRLDPILRILLKLYAYQLARIDKRIDHVWEHATEALIRTLCPESLRWPVPAVTVMRCEPQDPLVEVDTHTKFFYKEQREGGQTFFFSPLRKESILSANVKYIFLKSGSGFIDLSPTPEKESAPAMVPTAVSSGGQDCIYFAVDYDAPHANFNESVVFIKGVPDVLRQLQWGYWYPGTNFGSFYDDAGFCPGLDNAVEKMFSTSDKSINWGGLRASRDLFTSMVDNFVVFPRDFVATWELGPPDEELNRFMTDKGYPSASEGGHYYWVRVDLPESGDRNKFQSGLGIYFDSFIVANKNELTLFKHTGGYRLVEIEIPDNIENIFEITRVVDSNAREYKMRHELADRTSGAYTLEERDGRLVLWFDFSPELEHPPDSITVNYSVTSGTAANGIESARINELYESHPGIVASESILPTGGAIPARTREQTLNEIAGRLRNRDRALSFSEISNWAISFDPRIKKAECRNSIERFDRGVSRCIVVNISVNGRDFYSDDEKSLLQNRLSSFLKSRAPVNTRFKIELNIV